MEDAYRLIAATSWIHRQLPRRFSKYIQDYTLDLPLATKLKVVYNQSRVFRMCQQYTKNMRASAPRGMFASSRIVYRKQVTNRLDSTSDEDHEEYITHVSSMVS